MNSNNRCFNVVFWNVRGLGDSDKCNLVRRVFLDARPNIVCIQESKLAEIDAFKAKTFLPTSLSNSFVLSPAAGTHGGLVTAWDPTIFTLQSHFLKPYTLTTVFTCNASNLDFTVTNTYGPADHTASASFLQHLRDLHPIINGPWILLGDFNLVRCPSDKNNGQINSNLATAFNDTIHDLLIEEVVLSDRLYTWSNKQPFPILAKLDRALTNNELNLIFPLTCLTSLPQPTSDHTPLLLSLSTDLPKPSHFRLENSWLRNRSFLTSITQAWQQAPTRSDDAGTLVACIKAARAAAKAWSRCNRAPPELTQNCQFIIQLFDFFEETRNLSNEEFQVRRLAQETLTQLLKDQATYWRQRSKYKAIREADANTKFHHAHATQRLRRNYIRMIRVQGAEVVSHSGKTAALTDYFQSIIGVPGESTAFDLQRLFQNDYKPSDQLVTNFTFSETKTAIDSMNKNSAPGADGFGPAFFSAAWSSVKDSVMNFLDAFHSGNAQLECINRSFRPICRRGQMLWM